MKTYTRDAAYLASIKQTVGKILCCLCGTSIDYNQASMCVHCLRAQVDITETIADELKMYQCRTCLRYWPGGARETWYRCEWESPQLLALCLKMIPNLNKHIRLVDAGLVWTEPHCKRIKIKVTVQKAVEAANGQLMQQSKIVEYVVRNKMCVKCMASYTNASWNSVVQLRQRVEHKRTFFFLEQLVISQNAHKHASDVVLSRDGLDFYFVDRKHAITFTHFISSVIPTREKFSNKLIETNISNGTENRKYTFFMEIASVCKDDLLLLHPKLAAQLSNISPVVLVRKVRSSIMLIDPLSTDVAELTGDKKSASAAVSQLAHLAQLVKRVETTNRRLGMLIGSIWLIFLLYVLWTIIAGIMGVGGPASLFYWPF